MSHCYLAGPQEMYVATRRYFQSILQSMMNREIYKNKIRQLLCCAVCLCMAKLWLQPGGDGMHSATPRILRAEAIQISMAYRGEFQRLGVGGLPKIHLSEAYQNMPPCSSSSLASASSASSTRVSSLSSLVKHERFVPFVRRDISLVGVGLEAENNVTTTDLMTNAASDTDQKISKTSSDNMANVLKTNIGSGPTWPRPHTLAHDNSPEQTKPTNEKAILTNATTNITKPQERNDPICRVVATSDGKIPLVPALSSLSPSSKSLLEKIELIFEATSQRELRSLTYPMSRPLSNTTKHISSHAQSDSQVGGDELKILEGQHTLTSILKRSLEEGGFKLMDHRDLDLCSALNAGYLLRLSLLPDVQDLDPNIGSEFYPELFSDAKEVNRNLKGTASLGIARSASTGAHRGFDGIDSNKTNLNQFLSAGCNGRKNELIFDGKVLVFRRGYSQEITTGRLLLPKLDYLQASLVQRSSAAITKRLGLLEQRLEDMLLKIMSEIKSSTRRGLYRLRQRCRKNLVKAVEDLGIIDNQVIERIISKSSENASDGLVDCEDDQKQSDSTSSTLTEFRTRGSKIFKLDRYGVGVRSSSPIPIPNSIDLNDALSPFLLCEVEGRNMTSSVEQDTHDMNAAGQIWCQYDDDLHGSHYPGFPPNSCYSNSSSTPPTCKSPPAVRLLERVSIQNTVDFFSNKGRRNLIRNYFKSSTLMEPAFEEVIVIWRPMRKRRKKSKKFPWSNLGPRLLHPPKWLYETAEIFEMEDRLPKPNTEKQKITHMPEEANCEPMPIEIKAFYDVPMANLPAVLPKTKLIFRPADAFVFDLVSVVSFVAVVGSLRFDSPKLDFIALLSLVFFAVRTFLRYSNKYARYDLLVNKFLTSKISHRGSGALKYLVSEANSQRALRAMMVRDWLREDNGTVNIFKSLSGEGIGNNLKASAIERGKSYVNGKVSTDAGRIDVDICSALNDLERLGLIDRIVEEQNGVPIYYEVKKEQAAQHSLKQSWDRIFNS